MMTPMIPLRDGRGLPALGLGCWKLPNDRATEVVRSAIALGYRHIDSACDYGNEREVGAGIRQALGEGLCRREELWITSKLWNTYHAREHVGLAAKRSLSDLGLDDFDLYLVHFPIALKFVPLEQRYPPGWLYDPSQLNPRMEPVAISLRETWAGMEELYRAGLTRSIGVSNVPIALLRELLATAEIPPAVLQVELHPLLTQDKLLRFCREQQIAVTGFSPLGAPSYLPLGMARPEESLLIHPLILEIAGRHGRTPAQVLLRWGVQRGTAVIPKTARPERLAENLAIFDWSLHDDEMTAISALNQNRRFNDPGVFCEAAFGTFYPIYE